MRNVAMLLCLAVLVGCAKPQPATVHGKTLEHWIQALQDRDGRVRRKAVEALGNVGAADAAVVPAVAGALKDRDAGVRAAATLALLKIGPAAEEAVPALIDSQNDKDARVREYATKALERIQDRK